jgi:hypothetical protein
MFLTPVPVGKRCEAALLGYSPPNRSSYPFCYSLGLEKGWRYFRLSLKALNLLLMRSIAHENQTISALDCSVPRDYLFD